jgi:hypothetical protein
MAQYDPNKKYTWTPQDEFTLSGAEFGLLLNSFRAILSTEQAQQVLLANRANEVVEAILARAVENDVVKEAQTPSTDGKTND